MIARAMNASLLEYTGTFCKEIWNVRHQQPAGTKKISRMLMCQILRSSFAELFYGKNVLHGAVARSDCTLKKSFSRLSVDTCVRKDENNTFS